MRPFLCALAILLALGLLAGCGGSQPAAVQTSGRAVFTVQWPLTSGRLIPVAANSIKVEIKKGTTSFATKILARPAGGGSAGVTFDPLPLGDLTAAATAYPNADGTGTVQATAAIPLHIQSGQSTAFGITMASTIDHLELSPANPTVQAGAILALTVTAKDGAGSVVLTTPSTLQWSVSGSAASVDVNGVVTGITSGSATVSVIEKESGKTVSIPVTVTPQTFVINGVTYIPSTPQETLTATFTPSEGGVTNSSYQGYVLIHVTGVGQSYAQVYNDAFYLYSNQYTNAPEHSYYFYQLAFATYPLPEDDVGNNVFHFLVGTLPAYNPAHDYSFVLNTGATSPSQLHFGVSDTGYSDNTGAYTITVMQLIPEP